MIELPFDFAHLRFGLLEYVVENMSSESSSKQIGAPFPQKIVDFRLADRQFSKEVFDHFGKFLIWISYLRLEVVNV